MARLVIDAGVFRNGFQHISATTTWRVVMMGLFLDRYLPTLVFRGRPNGDPVHDGALDEAKSALRSAGITDMLIIDPMDDD